MKKRILIAGIILVIVGITGCAEKELDNDQIQKVNNAARTFFSAQTNGTKQGQFLSCSGMDSDRDGNVTCTGQVPNNDGMMVFQEIICSYKVAAGCKRK